MTDALAYAMTVAPDDVRRTLQWLSERGYTVAESRGPAKEAFGNLLLQLASGASAVTVIRDRSQWLCDIESPAWHCKAPLHVLLTAISGKEPLREWRDPEEHLPEQLPPGVAWADAVPAVLEWGAAEDRTEAVRSADTMWRSEMRERFTR